ncbi:MAG: hypothetical protein LUC91_01740 [Prevotella sp.]|nr:hypothetical protein [Prevotella sp.]
MADKEKTLKWREVTIGGVSGILLGTAGTMFAGNLNDQNVENEDELNAEDNPDETQDTQEQAPQATGPTPYIPNNGEVATSVNDDMSFGEAFAAARDEIGAGGYFVWHGNVYGTYYANEWNSMSETQQYQFSTGSSHAPHSYANNTTHVSSSHDTTNDTVEPAKPQEDDTDDFKILGVEHVDVDNDGEQDSIVGVASVSGQAVYFVDVDGEDDEFEIMMSDVNANGKIDDDEMVDISSEHIHVSDFEQIAQAESPQAAVDEYYASNEDLPDYVNDADPVDLA